ncbi:hypothetical protein V2J09_007864 [Rumex salicifolius]
MGLLEKLWDDTVAGPRPDFGLGKLRKYYGTKDSESGSSRSTGEESTEETMKVTRRIMIVKPPGYHGGSPLVSPSGSTTPFSPAGSTPPISPAGSTPPVSPFSGEKILVSNFRHLILAFGGLETSNPTGLNTVTPEKWDIVEDHLIE